MENKIEVTQEVKTLVIESNNMVEKYDDYKVVDNDSNLVAAKDLTLIKTQIKMLTDMRLKKTRPLDEIKKDYMNLFKPPIERLNKLVDIINDLKVSWRRKEEAKRIAEERRLQELARKEEEKRVKALEKRIDNAKAKGKEEKAEDLEQQKEEIYVPTPIVPSQVEKVQGEYVIKNWKYRIINVNKIPLEYMTPDTVKIGATVRAQKETCKIEGIEVYCEETIGTRK